VYLKEDNVPILEVGRIRQKTRQDVQLKKK